MMNLPQPVFHLTPAEYLAWEAEQDERHEYIRGEVYAMAGGTLAHNAATLAIGATLRQHLKGTPCRVFVSDVKVRIEASDAHFYPDVVVTCAAQDVADPKALLLREPLLIVEVLSPSTAAFDRGGKFAHYRLLPSLQEYVLIDPDTAQVDVFRRNAANRWELYPSDGPQTPITLSSIHWEGVVQDWLS